MITSKNDKQAEQLLSAYIAEFLHTLQAMDGDYLKDGGKKLHTLRKKIDGTLDALESRV